jgi:very-short-patch-repair endonuclease
MLHLRAHKLPEPVREFRFAPDRKWRFDMAWPVRMLAVEVEGAVWTGGRHTRGSGYVKDLEKYNRAAILGWRVLRFSTEQVKRGEAVAALRSALA